MPMENGAKNAAPETDGLSACVEFRYAQVPRVACPTFNLDLAGTRERQSTAV